MSFASVLFARFARLRRKSQDLRASGGSFGRVVAYNARFVMKKFPLLWKLVGAKRERQHVLTVLKAGKEAADAPPEVCVNVAGAGIGDHIIAARFVRDLAKYCGPITADFASYYVERDEWVFRTTPGFRAMRNAFLFGDIAPHYALAIEISQVVSLRHVNEAHPALSITAPLGKTVRALRAFQDRYADDIAGLPYSSAQLGRKAVYANCNRATFLQAQAGIAYGGDLFDLPRDDGILARLGLRSRSYVTVHNGFGPEFIISGSRATKCYPYLAKVVDQLKRKRPNLVFVQLGRETSTPIPGVDRNLLCATTMPEVVSLLANAALHLDNESGLVHLAACSGTRSCVIFGPTDADYFGYPNNINVRPALCGGCWWINDSWLDQCPRGFETAPCMASISPDQVVDGLLPALADGTPKN